MSVCPCLCLARAGALQAEEGAHSLGWLLLLFSLPPRDAPKCVVKYLQKRLAEGPEAQPMLLCLRTHRSELRRAEWAPMRPAICAALAIDQVCLPKMRAHLRSDGPRVRAPLRKMLHAPWPTHRAPRLRRLAPYSRSPPQLVIVYKCTPLLAPLCLV